MMTVELDRVEPDFAKGLPAAAATEARPPSTPDSL